MYSFNIDLSVDDLTVSLNSSSNKLVANFEIIIKDGGSTDGSVEKLEELPADSRIRFFREPDKGIYDGMNQALAQLPKLKAPAEKSM